MKIIKIFKIKIRGVEFIAIEKSNDDDETKIDDETKKIR